MILSFFLLFLLTNISNALTLPWPVLVGNYYFDVPFYTPVSTDTLGRLWAINSVVDTTQSRTTECSADTYVVGGYGMLTAGDSVGRTIDSIPSHGVYFYTVKLYLIDQWSSGDTINVKFDGVTVMSFQPYDILAVENTPLCGIDSDPDDLVVVKGGILHTASTLTFSVETSPTNLQASFAVSDLRIRFAAYQLGDIIGSFLSIASFDGVTKAQANSLSYVAPCPSGFYYDSSTCQDCHGNCMQCYGPTASECYTCAAGMFYNPLTGSCASCTPGCSLCTGTGTTDCVLCDTSSRYLYWDGSCRTSCPSPNVQVTTDMKRCKTPCQDAGTFQFKDNLCYTTCNPLVFTTDVEGSAKFCDAPCTTTTSLRLYLDGVCRTGCTYPLTYRGNYVCNPCPSGQFVATANNTCVTTCDPPYTQRTVEWATYCDEPSATGSSGSTGSSTGTTVSTGSGGGSTSLSPSETEEVKAIQQGISSAGVAGSAMGAAISIINFANPTAFFTQSFADILGYIKYLKINYPPKVEYSFHVQVELPFQIIPNPPEEFVNAMPQYTLPDRFQEYTDATGLTSSFMINFWDSLVKLSAIVVVICLGGILKFFTRNFGKIQWLCLKLLAALRWNFTLGFFTSLFGNIVCFSSLEFRTTQFDGLLSFSSFILATVVHLFVLLTFVQMILVVNKYRNLRRKYKNKRTVQKFIERDLAKYQVVFEGFKEESVLQQYFMILFTLRIYLFVNIVAYLSDFPLVQIGLILFMSITMILYLIICRPFKSILDFLQYLVQELIMLLVKSCVLTLGILDHIEDEDSKTRETIGDIMLNSNLALCAVSLLYLVIQTCFTLRNYYRFVRSYYRKPHQLSVSPIPEPKTKMTMSIKGMKSQVQNPRNNSDVSSSRDLQTSNTRDITNTWSIQESVDLVTEHMKVDSHYPPRQARLNNNFSLEIQNSQFRNEPKNSLRNAELSWDIDLSNSISIDPSIEELNYTTNVRRIKSHSHPQQGRIRRRERNLRD